MLCLDGNESSASPQNISAAEQVSSSLQLHVQLVSGSFQLQVLTSFYFPLVLKGPVPPNATVVFEVEVLSVSRGPRSMEAFSHIDLDKDRSLTKAEVTTETGFFCSASRTVLT